MKPICDECETVAHCSKHGCIPKQTSQLINHLKEQQLAFPKRKYIGSGEDVVLEQNNLEEFSCNI